MEKIPKDIQKKLESLQKKVDKFKDKILAKFSDNIVGINLLPPDKEDKDSIKVLVLLDDTDSKKMSKEEIKEKSSKVINDMAKSLDKNLKPDTMLLSELWQACYDGKNEVLQGIALSHIIYEKGMMSAIKISEIHKSMVLKKFEKYIVAYVLGGSLVQGKATKDSDIDVFIIIDDTDVKRMTRAELKDKLRMIILQMGFEAGEITGIKNKLNIQVYILTDFWDFMKEANPVIFTFLRDGIPFYDRGIFMPWKNLLKMGRVKPSPESIDMLMNSGEQFLDRANFKFKDIGMEDTFWAILTPSQAALMMYGIPPPTPKETPDLMREVFVSKKLLEEKYVKILENNIQVRKELEHGSRKAITGKEVDELLTNAKDYLDRIKKLFTMIGKTKEQDSISEQFETVVSVAREALKIEGVKGKIPESNITKKFDEELIQRGKFPDKFLRILKELLKLKSKKSFSKSEAHNIEKKSREFIRAIIEFSQRRTSRSLESAKIRVVYDDQPGEIIFTKNAVFLIKGKEIKKTTYSFSSLESSSDKEFKESVKELAISKVALNQKLFKLVRDFFGSGVEVRL